ncbi:LysR substrate-binding domain-containing protein [Methylobacterium sp. JK268]
MPIIAGKNIAGVDLNLLVAFEALLDERSVTRAGARIGLAQPSMSGALTRLRALFGDDLFRRAPGGMVPTPRAMALAGPVREALRQVRLALDPEAPFDPATTRRPFRIAVTDYGDLIIVPALVRALRAQAPRADLQVHPLGDADAAAERLERGDLDLLVGGHLPLPRTGSRHLLFEERFVAICAASRAADYARLDLAGYAALPHALFSRAGGDHAPPVLDALLARHGLHRRVALRLPHATALPFAIAGTDLVAALAERVARRLAAVAEIAVIPLPAEIPPFAVDAICTQPSLLAPPVRWLVRQLVSAGARIAAQPPAG